MKPGRTIERKKRRNQQVGKDGVKVFGLEP